VVYCKLLFSVHVAFIVLWGVAVSNQQLATWCNIHNTMK